MTAYQRRVEGRFRTGHANYAAIAMVRSAVVRRVEWINSECAMPVPAQGDKRSTSPCTKSNHDDIEIAHSRLLRLLC